jgi:DNA-binding response OmpR family regulator
MYKILSIEDSIEVQIMIKASLSPNHTVVFATGLAQGKIELKKNNYDILVLDIGLPDGDGIRFCSELKNITEFSSLPILILTSSDNIQDKILGFSIGIEDFIVKPFNPLELKARIEARLKSISVKKESQQKINIGSFEINLSTRKIFLKMLNKIEELDFTNTEFKIFHFLARNIDTVKSREQILNEIWGEDQNFYDRTVDCHISRIRKKINKGYGNIEAVTGFGYKFILLEKEKDF